MPGVIAARSGSARFDVDDGAGSELDVLAAPLHPQRSGLRKSRSCAADSLADSWAAVKLHGEISRNAQVESGPSVRSQRDLDHHASWPSGNLPTPSGWKAHNRSSFLARS